MTPNDIEILLHCHTTPGVHPRIDAPYVRSAIDMFVSNGIIEQREGDGYSTTSKGRALVEVLCSTPFPIEAWVDSNGKVIEIQP